MSLLRPALRPALNPITKTLLSVSRRFFTQFDDVAQSYVSLNSMVNLVSDYEIEFKSAAPYSGASAVLGNTGFQFRNVIFVSDGNIFLRDDAAVTISTNTAPIPENDLSLIRVVRTSGNVEVFVNGVSVLSAAHGAFNFNQLGVRDNADLPFNGIIADVKIIDNGTTVLDMPINQNYTPTNNTVIDRASGNNGTFVNVADGDSTFYQLIGAQWVDADGNAIEVAY